MMSWRWHFKLDDGKTRIVYGSQTDALRIANKLAREAGDAGPYVLSPSGYYDYDSNTIIDSADGPTIYIDNSGGRI
jgi:hypothetical protein